MILFYTISILLIVCLLSLVYYLIRKYKHDRALNRFKKTKYTIQLYMAKEFQSFSKQDIEDFKDLLNQVNATITDFEKLKISLFNFRMFKRLALDVIKKLGSISYTRKQRVSKYQEMMGSSYLLAFSDLVWMFRVRTLTFIMYQTGILLCRLKIFPHFNVVYDKIVLYVHKYKLEKKIRVA